MEGQRLQNAKSFAKMLKAPHQSCRLVSLLLLLSLRWHQSNRKHLCLLPAQRPTLGLLRGAHPPAAAGSAAENSARSNSHCHRTPLPPPALSFSPCAPAESQARHPPCHLAPRLRSGGWFPKACALAAARARVAASRGTSQ